MGTGAGADGVIMGPMTPGGMLTPALLVSCLCADAIAVIVLVILWARHRRTCARMAHAPARERNRGLIDTDAKSHAWIRPIRTIAVITLAVSAFIPAFAAINDTGEPYSRGLANNVGRINRAYGIALVVDNRLETLMDGSQYGGHDQAEVSFNDEDGMHHGVIRRDGTVMTLYVENEDGGWSKAVRIRDIERARVPAPTSR